jgi:hypothetical protein
LAWVSAACVAGVADVGELGCLTLPRKRADPLGALRERFRRDRWFAHRILFEPRHEFASAPYHRELVDDFWSEEPDSVILAFRGAGKTTTDEEDVTIAAVEGVYRNILLIGSNEGRAAEPLAAIKNEIAMNEVIHRVYGELRGDVWTQTKIVLANGVCVQALGRDQDIRGIKHLDFRPDLVLVTDFEDKDNVQTPEGRRKTLRWFLRELLPACDPRRKVRVHTTPMDAESVPMLLIEEDHWPNRVFPICYLDEAGEEQPSWPGSMFTMEWIERTRARFRRLGDLDGWEQEYMCRAVSEEARFFRREDMRVVPRTRVWEGVWCMIDPARTVGRASASTGWAAWSWVRNRLVVWDAGGEMLLPDAIVDLAFRLNEELEPIEVGVEKDGLDEFLLQPLRHAGSVRRVSLPFRGVRAPRGKHAFIRGLQPFFRAGEVEFVKPLETLADQLLGFPRGRIDAPNALAYAVLNRPGLPIYEAFDPRENIVEGLAEVWGRPIFLACNAKSGIVSAALMQFVENEFLVLADWLIEGDALAVFESIAREASMMCGRSPVVVAGSLHWQHYGNLGLVQAAKSVPMEVRRGGDQIRGRSFLTTEFERRGRRGAPRVQIADTCRWTLNALAGGYARPQHARVLSADAEDNRYRVLMEGIEAFAGLLALGVVDSEDEETGNFSYDRQGRRYRSAMPGLGARH